MLGANRNVLGAVLAAVVGDFTATSATVRQGNVPSGHVARTATYRIRSENALGESSWRQLELDVNQTAAASQ